jgi:hypothetical protein
MLWESFRQANYRLVAAESQCVREVSGRGGQGSWVVVLFVLDN